MTRRGDPLEPWGLSLEAGPEDDDDVLLERVVGAAILAPSGHNTQPWRFVGDGPTLELWADRSRALPVVDPEDRELVISCGCALLNIRIAAAALGRAALVSELPDPARPDLLARVELGERAAIDPESADLLAMIPRRSTNRSMFATEPISAEVVDRLRSAAESEGARLVVATDAEARAALADLVADGDRRQMADRRFRRELAAWLAPNRGSRRDGIPGYGLGISDLKSIVGPLVIRTFDVGRSQAARDRALATGSPALCVLLTDGDGPGDHLRAGQAHALATLVARREGLWTSYLNQPVEVEELRPRVAGAVGAHGHAQLLTRIGVGPVPRPTPRRGIGEVLERR